MCEILFRVKDKEGAPELALGKGDVVAICGDGWQWSGKERANPDWRILSLPGVSESQCSTFLQQEHFDGLDSRVIVRSRSSGIDLSWPGFPEEFSRWLSDDDRADPIYRSDWTAEFVLNAISHKAPGLVVFAP